MIGLLDRALAPVYLSTSTNKGRKYIHTLELIQPDAQLPTWVGIHSAKANAIVASLLERRCSLHSTHYEFMIFDDVLC